MPGGITEPLRPMGVFLALSLHCWLACGGGLSSAVLVPFRLPCLVPWAVGVLWLVRGWGMCVCWVAGGPSFPVPLRAAFCASVVLVVALPGTWACCVPGGFDSLLGVVS